MGIGMGVGMGTGMGRGGDDAYKALEGGVGGGKWPALPSILVGSGVGMEEKGPLHLLIGIEEGLIPRLTAVGDNRLEVRGRGGMELKMTPPSLWTFSWHVWVVISLYRCLMVLHTYVGTTQRGLGCVFFSPPFL